MTKRYFGDIPQKYWDEGYPSDWDEPCYFRLVIDEDNEDVRIEDTCGRMVPISFEHLKELQKTIKYLRKDYLL